MSSKTQIIGQLENLIGDFVAEYSEINNAPIIKADLNSITQKVEGTYYQHTGNTGTYISGAIYYYNNSKFNIINGSGGGSGGSSYDDTAIKNEIATLKKSKQDTLIEGDNISIIGNTISASVTVTPYEYGGTAEVAGNMLILNDNESSGGNVDLSGYATTQALNSGLAGKVDKVDGKGLSTNDFTDSLKTKLENLTQNNISIEVVDNNTLKITS